MGNSNSSHKISEQDRAILEMKNQRDKLHQYQKRITTITSRETEIAKDCLRQGNKSKALLALRRKKYQESLLAKTDKQLEQLEQLTADVEFALVQKDVLYGLQQGTAVLKAINKEMGGLDRIEMLLEDNAEARAYQKEISEMLGNQMSNEDEDAVEDELEAMEREVGAVSSLPNAPSIMRSDLPDVPQETPEEKARRRRHERAERERNERQAEAA